MKKSTVGAAVAITIAILYGIYLFITYETTYDLVMNFIHVSGSALVLFAFYIGQNRKRK